MATTGRTTIVSVFDDAAEAQRAVQELVNAGIPRDAISVVANDRTGSHAASLTSTGDTQKTVDGTSVGENVAAGAGFGALGGLLLGLGALAIPGIGPVVAAGPLAATLGGALTGAAGGGVIGALKDAGVPDDDAQFYSEALRRGSSVVTVHADEDMAQRVSDILDRHNAVQVGEREREYRESGWNQFDASAAPYANYDADLARRSQQTKTAKTSTAGTAKRPAATNVTGDQTISVVQEELAVGKRAIERGGVRVYSRVIETPVQESVTLTEEHARVERHPVNRPVSATEANAAFREQSIEVREMAEEAVVSKTARVVEEVTVGKEASTRTETISDTVRRTDVDVDRTGVSGSAANYDDDYRRHFTTNFGASGAKYETYAPAYQYGSQMANDQRYRGRSFDDVEDTLRTDYLRNNPNSTWDQTKGAVRYGWERLTGQRGEDPTGVTHGTRTTDLNPFDDDYRTHYTSTYGTSGRAYDDYRPAYQYGSQMANDQRYRGRSFDDVEDTLRTDYLRNNPNSTWDNVKGAVRYSWEKTTGKR